MVLDGALAFTEPKRFQSIAGVLFDLGDAERQVFYLTPATWEATPRRIVGEGLDRSEPAARPLDTEEAS